MAIDPTNNPLGLGDIDAGMAGWDVALQADIEGRAPQDAVHAGNTRVLEGNADAAPEALAPMKLKSYTVAGVPSAATFVQCVIWVSNESGGAQPAYSDGTNWRRVTDGAIVS